MAAARFVEFGAFTTIPAPYRCESAELYGFLFRADHDRLLDLCTKVFHDPTGGVVDYRPFGHHVLLTFGRIERIRPETSPYDEWGKLPESQVVVWVPVLGIHDMGPVLRADRFAMFVPYIWVDNALSMATGREAGGWPKSLGWPRFVSREHEPLDLRLAVYGWKFGRDNQPGRKPLLQVTAGAGPDGEEASEFKSMGELLESLWETTWDEDGLLLPGVGLVRDVLRDALHAELPELFLKQIRSADDPTTAVVQQVVTSAAKILHFSGRPLLGEHHLKVRHLDSCPIGQQLGLADQTTRLGFKVNMDFIQEEGHVVWDAAAEQHLDDGSLVSHHGRRPTIDPDQRWDAMVPSLHPLALARAPVRIAASAIRAVLSAL